MCKYCKEDGWKNDLTSKYADLTAYIYSDEQELVCDFSGEREGGTSHIKINFCPMCGRNLKEEEDEVLR